MTDPCLERRLNARLSRVHLPRVDVECAWNASTLTLRDGGVREAVWQQAKVATARGGNTCFHHLECRRWQLRESPPSARDPVRVSRHARISVARAPNGKKTRVIRVPGFDQGIERPLAARHDGEARGAKS